jgi:hypothetical protein
MNKAAVSVLADTETHGDLARVVNAMTAKEFAEAGDDVELVFDGAGSQWPGVLADPGHKVSSAVRAGTSGGLRRLRVLLPRLRRRRWGPPGRRAAAEEYKSHPSIRRLVQEGREVLTF